MPTGIVSEDGTHRNHVLQVDGIASEIGTGTTSSSAVAINRRCGTITTESLTTAQNGLATITLTNSKIAATSQVFVSVANGTNTQGTPMLCTVTPAAGSCTIVVANKHATAVAFNGTLKLHFMVVKAI